MDNLDYNFTKSNFVMPDGVISPVYDSDQVTFGKVKIQLSPLGFFGQKRNSEGGFFSGKNAPLGNNVNLQANCKILPMIERYRLLGLSKQILADVVRDGHNILGCQRVTMMGFDSVGITQSNAIAGSVPGYCFSGVKTCKSSWVCPVCSHSLSGARAAEVRNAIRAQKMRGGDVYMLTLTFRHSRYDRLGAMLGGFKKALVNMWAQCKVKSFFNVNFIGRITATEITYSDIAGWHPHQHILLLGVRGLDCGRLQALFAPYWLRALDRSGLSGIGDIACNVQSAGAVANYLTKMAGEIALGNTGIKQGRAGHYAPFELLGACRSRPDYHGLWREYYGVTKGRQCLAWSRGLKALSCVAERSDDDILDCSDGDAYTLVLSVWSEDWSKLSNDDLGYIRRAPSVDAITRLLDDRGAGYTMAVEQDRRQVS
jgi:hypothetical protein